MFVEHICDSGYHTFISMKVGMMARQENWPFGVDFTAVNEPKSTTKYIFAMNLLWIMGY